MNINNFLKSGFTFSDDEYALRLQYLLFNTTLSIVFVLLSFLSIIRYFEGVYLQSVLDIIVAIFSIYAMLYIKKSKFHGQKIIPILIIFFYFFVSASFITTSMYIVGPSWFLVLMIPSYYLGNLKIGFLVTTLSILTIIVLGESFSTSYTWMDYFYITIPLVMASFFIYFFTKHINTASTLLEEKNRILKKEVEKKTAEEIKLLQHNKELADIISKSNIELYILDYNTDYYLYANQGAQKALGYSLEELKTMTVYDINPSLSTEHVNSLKALQGSLENIMNISQHARKDGTIYGVQSLIHSINFEGKDAYVIYDINLSDVHEAQSQLLKQKELLLQQAYYDSLTKLPNRILFNDRLSQAISKSNRSKKDFAVLFIDLDEFKKINDTYGHRVGDMVLTEVAARLKNTLRKEDTIARLGGDEFVCLIEHIDYIDIVSHLAQKIINAIKAPVLIFDKELSLGCSIGISIHPKDDTDVNMLLHHADSAMYKAKDLGKGNYQFYSDIEDNPQIS